MFFTGEANFRFRILKDIFLALVVPPVLVSLCHPSLTLQFGWWSILAYLLAIILAAFIRVQYSDFLQAREARQLGARPIPRVVGKWPGNIDVMLRFRKAIVSQYMHEPYLELFEEYQCTTLNTRFLWLDNIISMDQEHVKYALATGFKQFWRGTAQRERLENFLGDGIFNRDGEKWKYHRSFIRPFFNRNRLSDFGLFEKYTTRTMDILSNISARDEPCDVQDLFARFTIDAASDFLFGQNLDTLSKKLPAPGSGCQYSSRSSATDDSWGNFAQAFEAVQHIITMRARIGSIWPIFELFEDKTVPHVEIIKRWLDPLVKQAFLHKEANQKAGLRSAIEENTFLHHLVDSTEDTGMIRDQLLNILLASRDTTACLLTYVTYFMALYPDIAAKMRQEMLDVCGDSVPTHDDIRKLKYVKAVIDETLRLYPPVPLNQRQSRPQPCVLPPPDRTYPTESDQPLYFPKSTSFWYTSLLTQRNKALWGPDADEFDPERWINPQRVAHFTSNPMMYTPFSAGPRICVGRNYAYNEASFFLVRLLQRFDTFTLAPDAQPFSSLPPVEWKLGRGRQAVETICPEATMTLFIKGGLWVRMKKTDLH